ncbi:hypothetical protein LCGC14_0350020 [marine sediment metagenome]|uniref:Uncharacterized protein n=1 Tax=marine sediment metagenome TaxID=412755 RepID=A0A0F9TB58_9ZZZZ
MTKREAIRECKGLWKEIERSGKSKWEFLESPAGKKWKDKDYTSDCPLCEYSDGDCDKCLLLIQYGEDCYDLGYEDDRLNSPSFFEAVRGLK